MKIRLIVKFGITAFLLCFITFAAVAQSEKGVSAADQKKIMEIFKDVPKSEYKLVFNNGKRVIGEKQIKMDDLKRVSKSSNANAAGVKWTFIVGDRSANEVIYIYTEGLSKMASLLGQKRLKALQDIAGKYEDVSPR